MKIRKTFFRSLFLFGMISALTLSLTACSDDDDVNNGNGNGNGNGSGDGDGEEITANTFFISVMGESSEYIMLSEEIESGELVITDNVDELEASGYTWIFNTDPSAAIGLIYQQGDAGLGVAYGVSSEGELAPLGQFQISTRFTSYGFFDKYALTSVGGQTLAGTTRDDGVVFNFINLENNAMTRVEKSMSTFNISGNGEQATTSGIVDMGDGTFLTGLVLSQPREEGATGGSSSGTVTYPDSVWVGRYDADLNLTHLYRDDRISYSSGRYRSQYYSQIGKADDGKIYVFSGSYDYNNNPTNRPGGAIRINSATATDFDPDYYFNIEEQSDGYRFRKVWHITGDYFLLEFYNHQGRLTDIDDPASQYAVVHMTNKTFSWLGGDFPSKDVISVTGLPMPYEGKMYFPITAGSDNPTIYIIDPATAQATKGVSIKGAASIRAIGRLVEN